VMTSEESTLGQPGLSGGRGPAGGCTDAARQAVDLVVEECNTRIAAEKAKPKPDEWTIRRWVDRRASASTDLRLLTTDICGTVRAEEILARNTALLTSFRES
jgi:hypothetical protein